MRFLHAEHPIFFVPLCLGGEHQTMNTIAAGFDFKISHAEGSLGSRK